MDANSRLKLAVSPLWDKHMGRRLRIARERLLRTQGELAAILSTPESPVCKQQVAAIEGGRKHRARISWASLEVAVGAKEATYVIIARDEALYNERVIRERYYDYRQRAMRKRNGLDPKKGETPPWPRTPFSRKLTPRKRGSTR